MASTDGLASVEPWSFRQSFSVDSWLLPPENLSRDNNLLTGALQRTISSSQQTLTAPGPLSPSAFLDSAAISDPSPAPSLSNVSGGSDPDSTGTKRKRTSVPVAGSGGKPSKRRSRVSKKSQTTFITADAANFRQMVQQVTGAKYMNTSHGIFAPIVKPEPQRLASRLPCGPSERLALPTLDTSAFLSNHHQESLITGNTFTFGGPAVGSGPITSFQSTVSADLDGSAREFDAYPNFPTLESWKVM